MVRDAGFPDIENACWRQEETQAYRIRGQRTNFSAFTRSLFAAKPVSGLKKAQTGGQMPKNKPKQDVFVDLVGAGPEGLRPRAGQGQAHIPAHDHDRRLVGGPWPSLSRPIAARSSCSPTGGLSRSVGEEIDISRGRKDDFRREIMNYIGTCRPTRSSKQIAVQTVTTSHAAFRCF